MGMLDSQYCEVEIPPLPELDVFDARWSIPTLNGTHRNIYPTAVAPTTPGAIVSHIYNCIFQAGGVGSTGSQNYPVVIQ